MTSARSSGTNNSWRVKWSAGTGTPILGDLSYPPSPVKLSGWRHPNQPAPMLGEHTTEVLMKKLNYSPESIDDLAARGVVHTGPDDGGGSYAHG